MRVYHQGVPPKKERDVTVGVDRESVVCGCDCPSPSSQPSPLCRRFLVCCCTESGPSFPVMAARKGSHGVTDCWSMVCWGNELEKTEKIRPRHLTFAPLWK